MTLDSDPPVRTGSGSDEPEGLARRRAREEPGGGSTAAAEVADGSDGRSKRAEPKSAQRNLLEWVGVIGGAILIALVVRTFIFQTFWIPSPSMSPTLVRNDRVLVNKLSYKVHDIHRGDVVVFERPTNEPDNKIKDLIKRVIALPGERVSVRDGEVQIDGRSLTEPYTHDLQTIYQPGCGTGDVTGIDTEQGLKIPAGHVFVMGDNRVNSTDGRCFGPIDEDLVVGRAFFIIWPPAKAGGL
ncbi:MAG: signal peptidase I [Acidimicrobiales bacterium]